MNRIAFLILFLLTSCREAPQAPADSQHARGEYIYRLHDEFFFTAESPKKLAADVYPWEEGRTSTTPRITKEHFRCKGTALNPVRTVERNGEKITLNDCGGSERHSLPLRDGKEFVYPVLVDLLNHIQFRTGKKLVITSGHRCPEHNAYVSQAKNDQYSKHMIGAEVSFYVQGFEERPEKIVALIQEYYKGRPKEYSEFQRYQKGDTDVSTQPWMNKEVFVKVYKKHEGRDLDNRHPYPYVAIQVRFDPQTNERVIYSWEKANNNFLRK